MVASQHNPANQYDKSWEIYKAHSERFKDDLEYYRRFCTDNGARPDLKVLELFAGYGRVTNYLDECGINVETVELDSNFSAFINLASSKKHIADILEFDPLLLQPPRQYDRIFAAYNSFCLFRADQMRRFFWRLSRMLKIGGRASLNYYHPAYWHRARAYEFTYQDRMVEYRPSYKFPRGQYPQQVCVAKWIDTYRDIVFGEKEVSYTVTVYPNDEWQRYMEGTGLRVVEKVRNFGLAENRVFESGFEDTVIEKVHEPRHDLRIFQGIIMSPEVLS